MTILYRFDEVDERLDLLPLSARRALDRAGCRLSLEGWRSLPLEVREAIARAGAAADVDAARVLQLAAAAKPPPEPMEPRSDPPADTPPAEVAASYGAGRPLSAAVWRALSPLDRYALGKVAERGRPERLAAAYDEIIGHSAVSTHLGPGGGARMVSVATKEPTTRRAVARSRVTMSAAAFERMQRADVPKGDVLGTARIAGIQAAKRTAEWIPLCHPVALTRVAVDFAMEPPAGVVAITAQVEAIDRTGVEMEALVAASAAGLTIYDMLKGIDRAMTLGPTELVEKSGGRSGDFRR